MNPKTTALLLVLSIVGTAFTWWDSGRTEFHFQRDLDQPFPFPESALDELTIRTETVFARIQRAENRWELVEPFEQEAEYPSVEAISHLVRDLRVRGEGGTTGPGLDDPRIEIQIRATGRSPQRLRIGDPHPTLPYVYAAIDERVILIDPQLPEILDVLTLEDLRQTAICPIPPTNVERLRIERGETAWTVERAENEWRLTEPAVGDANAVEVVRLLESLNSWGVHSFVTEPLSDRKGLAEYGLEPPTGTIEVTPRHGGGPIKIEWGSRVPLPETGESGVYLYLHDSKCVVRATAALFARLPATSEEWESRRLVRVPQRDVIGITLIGDYRKVEFLKNQQGGWRQTWAGDGIPAASDVPRLVTMIESLRGAEVEEFLPLDDRNLQKYGFDRPSLDVELVRQNGDRERILVGKEAEDDPGFHYVWNFRWSRYAIARVPDLARWRGAPFSLRDRAIFSVPEEALRRVRVGDGQNERQFLRTAQGWRPLGADATEPSAAVVAFLDAIPSVAVDQWVPRLEDPAGPDRFALRVDILPVEPFDAEPWVQVWISPKAGNRRTVRVGVDGPVGVLDGPEDRFAPLERDLQSR